jgi:hypothetical protein
MPVKSIVAVVAQPVTWMLGLHKPNSFLNILRSQTFKYPVSKDLLESTSMRLVNPNHHCVKTDTVSIKLPAALIVGLTDEAVLALFTKGFFGGWIFAFERMIMRMGSWRILNLHFTGIYKNPVACVSLSVNFVIL